MTIKELFEQLVSQVDPDNELISESKRNELIQSFEDKISEVKTKAFEDSVETIDEDHSQKLQEVITIMESMDTNHASKLEEIVESIDDDHTSKLGKLIESIDDDHSVKFKHTLEVIDEEHATKMQEVMDKVDEEHTSKLQEVIKLYEDKENKSITEDVSEYLDTYLEDVKPKSGLVNEARLNKLETTFEDLRKVLMVNDEYVQTEVSEAILDAHNIIEEKEKEINRLMLERVETNKNVKMIEESSQQKVEKLEAGVILESKMKGCSPKLQAYLELCFESAGKEEIEEKFNEAVEAFKTTEKEKREAIIESRKEDNKGIIPETVKTEGIFEDKSIETDPMNMYADIINNTSSRFK